MSCFICAQNFPAFPLPSVQAQPLLPTPFPRVQVVDKLTNSWLQLSFNRRNCFWHPHFPMIKRFLGVGGEVVKPNAALISAQPLSQHWDCDGFFISLWTGSDAMNIDSVEINENDEKEHFDLQGTFTILAWGRHLHGSWGPVSSCITRHHLSSWWWINCTLTGSSQHRWRQRWSRLALMELLLSLVPHSPWEAIAYQKCSFLTLIKKKVGQTNAQN